jgi:hypothetical protein
MVENAVKTVVFEMEAKKNEVEVKIDMTAVMRIQER